MVRGHGSGEVTRRMNPWVAYQTDASDRCSQHVLSLQSGVLGRGPRSRHVMHASPRIRAGMPKLDNRL